MMDTPAWPHLWALLGALAPGVSLFVACAVDARWGEPPMRWHPVVAMGKLLGAMGPRLCALPPDAARLGGMLAWWLGALLSMAVALTLDIMLVAWLGQAWAGHEGAAPQVSDVVLAVGLRAVLLGGLLKPLMSWRMLRDEVAAVEHALAQSLQAGQQRLARLVSRDVTQLDAPQVRESAIETLAENLNDSVVAPLMWFLLLGLPGAALYRWANTADAMWGYRDHRAHMGWWSAKADDALSWLPARLTAALLCLAAGRWPGWASMRTEAGRTPSPNGGWPMGTMALLLGVGLSKPGVYRLHPAGRTVQASDVPQALKWAHQAVWLGVALAAALAALLHLLIAQAPH